MPFIAGHQSLVWDDLCRLELANDGASHLTESYNRARFSFMSTIRIFTDGPGKVVTPWKGTYVVVDKSRSPVPVRAITVDDDSVVEVVTLDRESAKTIYGTEAWCDTCERKVEMLTTGERTTSFGEVKHISHLMCFGCGQRREFIRPTVAAI